MKLFRIVKLGFALLRWRLARLIFDLAVLVTPSKLSALWLRRAMVLATQAMRKELEAGKPLTQCTFNFAPHDLLDETLSYPVEPKKPTKET